jgi:hypothetical protein
VRVVLCSEHGTRLTRISPSQHRGGPLERHVRSLTLDADLSLTLFFSAHRQTRALGPNNVGSFGGYTSQELVDYDEVSAFVARRFPPHKRAELTTAPATPERRGTALGDLRRVNASDESSPLCLASLPPSLSGAQRSRLSVYFTSLVPCCKLGKHVHFIIGIKSTVKTEARKREMCSHGNDSSMSAER